MADNLTIASTAFHVLSKMFAKELFLALASYAATARSARIFVPIIAKKHVTG